MIILPRPVSRYSPVDKANPLARDLKYLWGMQDFDGSRTLKSHTNRIANAAFHANNSLVLKKDGYGVIFNSFAAAFLTLGTGACPTSAGKFSIFLRFNLADVSTYQYIYSSLTSDAIGIGVNIGNVIILRTGSAGGGDSGAVLTANKTHDAAITYDGTSIKCYVDGILKKTTTDLNLAGATSLSGVAYGMGRNYDGHHMQDGGVVHHLGIYDRVITPQEVWQLHVNPEQLLGNNRTILTIGGSGAYYAGINGVLMRRRRRL